MIIGYVHFTIMLQLKETTFLTTIKINDSRNGILNCGWLIDLFYKNQF